MFGINEFQKIVEFISKSNFLCLASYFKNMQFIYKFKFCKSWIYSTHNQIQRIETEFAIPWNRISQKNLEGQKYHYIL